MRINSEIHTSLLVRSPTTYGSSCWYCRRRSCARAVGHNTRRRRRRRVYAAAAASAIPIKYRFGLRRRLRGRRAAVSVLLQRGIRGSGGDMQRHRRCLRRGGIDSRARSSRSGGGSSSRGGRRARGRVASRPPLPTVASSRPALRPPAWPLLSRPSPCCFCCCCCGGVGGLCLRVARAKGARPALAPLAVRARVLADAKGEALRQLRVAFEARRAGRALGQAGRYRRRRRTETTLPLPLGAISLAAFAESVAAWSGELKSVALNRLKPSAPLPAPLPALALPPPPSRCRRSSCSRSRRPPHDRTRRACVSGR